MRGAVTDTLEIRRAAVLSSRLIDERPDERESLDLYLSRGGYRSTAREDLAAALERAGLRGRGGAAFPSALKLASVGSAQSATRFVIANGEEGEPSSVKDRYLMRFRPHLVLDGLVACALAINAERAFVYLSDPIAEASLAAALVERPPPLSVELVRVDPSYVAGEETAAVRAIEHGVAKPTAKPPRPFEMGIGGHPTLVQNVETLAHIALILRDGPATFRAVGTERSTGSFLATVSTVGRPTVLIELPFGVTLHAVLREIRAAPEVHSVLMGGFFGGLLAEHVLDVPLSYEHLSAAGSGLGCAAISLFERDDCPIGVARGVMSYFARENAKQCGACINGTNAMEQALVRLSSCVGRREDVQRLHELGARLRGRGACATLDAAATLAESLTREFANELDDHLVRACRRCRVMTDIDPTPLPLPDPL